MIFDRLIYLTKWILYTIPEVLLPYCFIFASKGMKMCWHIQNFYYQQIPLSFLAALPIIARRLKLLKWRRMNGTIFFIVIVIVLVMEVTSFKMKKGVEFHEEVRK